MDRATMNRFSMPIIRAGRLTDREATSYSNLEVSSTTNLNIGRNAIDLNSRTSLFIMNKAINSDSIDDNSVNNHAVDNHAIHDNDTVGNNHYLNLVRRQLPLTRLLPRNVYAINRLTTVKVFRPQNGQGHRKVGIVRTRILRTDDRADRYACVDRTFTRLRQIRHQLYRLVRLTHLYRMILERYHLRRLPSRVLLPHNARNIQTIHTHAITRAYVLYYRTANRVLRT